MRPAVLWGLLLWVIHGNALTDGPRFVAQLAMSNPFNNLVEIPGSSEDAVVPLNPGSGARPACFDLNLDGQNQHFVWGTTL
jgi:hypothetical protein